MKKYLKIVSLVLALTVLCCTLCACGNAYPNVLKAFQEEGYTESSNFDALMTSLKESLEQEETVINFHLLYNITKGSAFIIEFQSTQELRDTIQNNEELKTQLKNLIENEDVQQLYQDAKDAGFVNGNCILIPIARTSSGRQAIVDIFKNA